MKPVFEAVAFITMEPRQHRRSVRLYRYDYSQPGAYFVTMVTASRACVFGCVVGEEMQLSDRGRIADECWRAIPGHFPNVELGTCVVMPNHIHGILILHDRADARRGTPWRAPTVSETYPLAANTPEQFSRPVVGSLATIVRQYKSSVTRLIVQQFGGVPRIWQRNYYEHVVRNEEELSRISRYIDANLRNWQFDEENV